MQFKSLLALAAAGALLLPLGANAGPWPAGKKGEYMDQCVQVSTGRGLDAKAADAHCKCGANVIEEKFSTAEIEALDRKDGVDAALAQRAKDAVIDKCSNPPKKK